jgi:hypothetical protein
MHHPDLEVGLLLACKGVDEYLAHPASAYQPIPLGYGGLEEMVLIGAVCDMLLHREAAARSPWK